MNKLFARHAFKIIFLAVLILPIMNRGARYALQSNDNNVHDWLPREYKETQDFSWFQKHFENETFVLVTWEGCTLDAPGLELLARKLVPEPWGGKTDGKALFKSVETGERLMRRMQEPPLSLSESEALDRLNGLFIGPDQRQTCAVVTLTPEGKRNLRKTLETIYYVAEKEVSVPRERIHLGGPPVDNVAISVEGEKTLLRLFIPAGIVGLSLAFWCLRSVRLTTMVFATALYAASISLAIVWYSGYSMNAILLSMPSVVYVAGISGAIHFANYYRDSAAEGGVEGAPARAVKHAWLPCILSAGTTAAGLFSLYTSELMPIKMFGIYSALGVLATLALLFLFLPSWMQLWPMKPHSLLDGSEPKIEDLSLPVRWRRFLQGVLNRHRLVFASLVVVMIFCGMGLYRINTSIKLTKLFSSDAQIIKDYQWLEDKLGPLVPMEVVLRIDPEKTNLTFLERMELVERVQRKMEGIPGLGNTMSAVTFAPSLEIKRAGFLNKRVMRNVLNRKLEDHRAEYISNDFVAVEGSEELWRISARVGALNDIDYGEFQSEIKARVEPALRMERARLAKRSRIDTAEAELDDNNTNDSGVSLVAYDDPSSGEAANGPDAPADSEAEQVTDAATYEGSQGLAATYTGLVPVVYKAQREMLNGLAMNFVTDLLTIAGVMTVVFWDLTAGLILLIPSVFPMLIVFGMMGWLGIVIDVGTIMTPTVALGVSVDDVVHFLIWYRKGLSEGKTRKEATMLAYEGCARAMYQSWAVLGLGLAVFALSSFVPTQRFGAMMFLLLSAALVGNMLLLPAVLSSPLAYFFGRRLVKQAQRKARERAAEEEATSHLKVPKPVLRGPHRTDTSRTSMHT